MYSSTWVYWGRVRLAIIFGIVMMTWFFYVVHIYLSYGILWTANNGWFSAVLVILFYGIDWFLCISLIFGNGCILWGFYFRSFVGIRIPSLMTSYLVLTTFFFFEDLLFWETTNFMINCQIGQTHVHSE